MGRFTLSERYVQWRHGLAISGRWQRAQGAGFHEDYVSFAQETLVRLPRSAALIRQALFWCGALMSCI
jgi:hypothetical protein